MYSEEASLRYTRWFKLLSRWIKSWSMTIQMEAIEQYLFVVLFIMLYKVVLTFELMDEIINYNHSNENHWAVLFCATVYFATQDGSKFKVCKWNHLDAKYWLVLVLGLIFLVNRTTGVTSASELLSEQRNLAKLTKRKKQSKKFNSRSLIVYWIQLILVK